MPVDSRNKRSSAIAIASPWRGQLALPDGAIGQADRQHAAFHYSGILAEGPAVGQPFYIRDTYSLPDTVSLSQV